MWSVLLLAATAGLPANQGGTLTLTNVRSTHGVLGPTRPSDKMLPGDTLFLCFDIEGIRVDGNGKVAYSIGTEVTSRSGRPVFKQEPRNLEGTTSLGGGRVPAFAEIRLGVDQEPGDFILKVTATDTAGRRSGSAERPFTVLPRGFGLVRLTTSSDQDGLLPSPIAAVGQPLWVNFGAVGFGRDSGTKQPNVTFQIRVLDDAGKPTTAKPITSSVNKDVPEKFLGLPMNFLLSLNRPGKFTVEIQANDQVARKTTSLSFPLTVHEAK